MSGILMKFWAQRSMISAGGDPLTAELRKKPLQRAVNMSNIGIKAEKYWKIRKSSGSLILIQYSFVLERKRISMSAPNRFTGNDPMQFRALITADLSRESKTGTNTSKYNCLLRFLFLYDNASSSKEDPVS